MKLAEQAAYRENSYFLNKEKGIKTLFSSNRLEPEQEAELGEAFRDLSDKEDDHY